MNHYLVRIPIWKQLNVLSFIKKKHELSPEGLRYEEYLYAKARDPTINEITLSNEPIFEDISNATYLKQLDNL